MLLLLSIVYWARDLQFRRRRIANDRDDFRFQYLKSKEAFSFLCRAPENKYKQDHDGAHILKRNILSTLKDKFPR